MAYNLSTQHALLNNRKVSVSFKVRETVGCQMTECVRWSFKGELGFSSLRNEITSVITNFILSFGKSVWLRGIPKIEIANLLINMRLYLHSALVNMYKVQKSPAVQRVGVSVFYQVVSCVCEDTLRHPPTRQYLSSCVEILGQVHTHKHTHHSKIYVMHSLALISINSIPFFMSRCSSKDMQRNVTVCWRPSWSRGDFAHSFPHSSLPMQHPISSCSSTKTWWHH